MPVWVKCILLLWVVRFVMMLFFKTHVMANAVEVAKELVMLQVKNYKEVPWYFFVFGATVIICRLSIIPLAVWFIFLR